MSNIFFRQENNLIIGSKNCIASYDLDKKEVNKTCYIDKAENLMLFDKKYILAKFKNREEIYKFDKEDFSAQKVLTNKKVAGDWLFIKSFDLKSEQSHLEEKIDLKNGKKIKK